MADAHTRIFHELMEPLLMLDLSGVQFRIIFWVARNSYGWGGNMTTPFSWSKIARDLKADRRAYFGHSRHPFRSITRHRIGRNPASVA